MAIDYGIDVSRYQNQPYTDPAGAINGYAPLDYKKAAGMGIKFAAVRATVGDNYIDPTFAQNYRGFYEQGLDVYPYLVVKPRNEVGQMISADGHLEAYTRAELQLKLKPRMPIVLDCEMTCGAGSAEITALIEAIIKRFDVPPIIYTRASWWDGRVKRSKKWASYKLWVAHYGTDNPTLPADWTEWYMHQYSADGNGLGKQYGCASHSVDLNRRKVSDCQDVTQPDELAIDDTLKAYIQLTIAGEVYTGDVYLFKQQE